MDRKFTSFVRHSGAIGGSETDRRVSSGCGGRRNALHCDGSRQEDDRDGNR
jgi:prepilin-type processing-associated H-X9-DG protein